MLKSQNKYFNYFIIFLNCIILGGIFIRIRQLLSSPSLWYDECSLTWNIIVGNFFDFFKPLKYAGQVAPPLFLVIEKFFYNIYNAFLGGTNLAVQDIFLRIFPCFCGCIAIPLFAFLLHRTYKNELITLTGTAILSMNPWVINYSNEVKQYSTELLFTIIFLILFTLFDLKKFDNKIIFLISVFCSISIWFSSTSLIFIFAGTLIILRCLKKRKTFLFYFTPIFLNLFIWYFIYFSQNLSFIGNFMQEAWSENFLTLKNFFPTLAMQWQGLFPDIVFYKYVGLFFYVIGFYILTSINIYIFFKQKNNRLLCMTLIPFIFVIIGSFLKKYPFSDRLLLFLIPLYIIILCQILLKFKNSTLLKIFVSLLILFTCMINIRAAFINPQFFIIHKSNIRKFHEIITLINPQRKNLILKGSNYFCYSKGNGEIILDSDKIFEINTLPQGNYYLFLTGLETKNYKNTVNYILNNLKVIQSFNTSLYNGAFFAQIKIK